MSLIINKIRGIKKWSLAKKIFASFSAFIILFTLNAGVFWMHRIFKRYSDIAALENLDISGVNKLMIVAHSDDETIWGGEHLMKGGYLVVCFTGGSNKIRKEEFNKAVKKLNETNIPFILDFPDKTFGKRDNWIGIKNNVINTVDYLLEMKNWDLIVTHNKDGEYGHIQHKTISNIVSSEYKKLVNNSTLYYFGKYHSKKKMPEFENRMIPMDDNSYKSKVEILKSFLSQKRVIDKLFHMMKYENWIKYDG